MHTIYSQTQYITCTKMNLSTVKWAQWDKTQSRELLGLFICVCIALCTIFAHNTAQNRPDNFPSCPPDNRHCSDDVYLRERGCLLPQRHSGRHTSIWPFSSLLAEVPPYFLSWQARSHFRLAHYFTHSCYTASLASDSFYDFGAI